LGLNTISIYLKIRFITSSEEDANNIYLLSISSSPQNMFFSYIKQSTDDSTMEFNKKRYSR